MRSPAIDPEQSMQKKTRARRADLVMGIVCDVVCLRATVPAYPPGLARRWPTWPRREGVALGSTAVMARHDEAAAMSVATPAAITAGSERSHTAAAPAASVASDI